MPQAFANLIDRWRAFPGRVRFALLLLPAAILAPLVMAEKGSREESWARVVGPEQPAQVREEVRRKLAAEGIQVAVRDGGLYVPRDAYSKVLVRLAGTGVISDEDLFRFLEEPSLTTTQWQMDRRWQVAVQRKLERILRGMEGVADAYVQITPGSEQRRIGEPVERAKAMVVLAFQPSHDSDSTAVAGIAHLVAAAARGLKVEDVRIMDRQGRMLWPGAPGGSASAAADRFSLERKYERSLEEKAMRGLGSICPEAKVTASVRLSARRIVQGESRIVAEARTARPVKMVDEVIPSAGGIKGHRDLFPVEPATGTTERRSQVEIPPGEIEQASLAVVLPAGYSGSAQVAELLSRATGVPVKDIYLSSEAPKRPSPDPLPWFPFAAIGFFGIAGASIAGAALLRKRRAARASEMLRASSAESMDAATLAVLLPLAPEEVSRSFLASQDRERLQEISLAQARAAGSWRRRLFFRLPPAP